MSQQLKPLDIYCTSCKFRTLQDDYGDGFAVCQICGTGNRCKACTNQTNTSKKTIIMIGGKCVSCRRII